MCLICELHVVYCICSKEKAGWIKKCDLFMFEHILTDLKIKIYSRNALIKFGLYDIICDVNRLDSDIKSSRSFFFSNFDRILKPQSPPSCVSVSL